MALTESASFVISSVLAILTFSGMQMLKPQLAASQPMTIVGGLLGSILYVFLLTAVGNLEKTLFGKGFQTKLMESIICLVIAVLCSASVHRVSATTCVLFSVGMLYSMYKISQETYGLSPTVSSQPAEKSKKKK